MMKMIRKTILSAALILAALGATAQGRMSVTQSKYALKGDSVYVELLVGLNDVQVAPRAFVLLTPAIQQGNVSMDLPPIMINGKNRQKAYRRLVALHREPVGVGQVIDASRKDAPGAYRYSAVVPYEPWMKEANFALREDQCECNGPLVPMSFDLMAGRMDDLNPPLAPPYKDVQLNFAVSFKVPNPEPVKNRSESGKAYLDFAVGRSELRPDFKGNASELARIDGLLAQLQKEPSTTITGITIDGFASPEGTYASNMTLSGRRAVALKEYVRTKHGLPERLIRTAGRGEDWEELENLVAACDAPYREQALAIIRGTEIFDGREKKLMELQGGAPYRQMLTELFPRLRRSDYEIKYTVIPFTVEEGKKVLETNPALLSLNEMFLIAQTYAVGSDEYSRVFDLAVKHYPGSQIANFNAGATALAARDAETAQAYLSEVVVRDAALENNLGVLAALRAEFDKAAAHFTKAKEGGNAEAARNLAEVEKIFAVDRQRPIR